MSRPTPRTSAAIIASGFQAVPEGFRAFAGNLERELAAEREKAERYRLVTLRQDAELAAERAKVRTLREAWLCGHTDGIDCGSGQRSTTDFVTFDESEAKAHVAKYKGSWTTEGWYRAIPVNASSLIETLRLIAHYGGNAQDSEMPLTCSGSWCAEQARTALLSLPNVRDEQRARTEKSNA